MQKQKNWKGKFIWKFCDCRILSENQIQLYTDSMNNFIKEKPF